MSYVRVYWETQQFGCRIRSSALNNSWRTYPSANSPTSTCGQELYTLRRDSRATRNPSLLCGEQRQVDVLCALPGWPFQSGALSSWRALVHISGTSRSQVWFTLVLKSIITRPLKHVVHIQYCLGCWVVSACSACLMVSLHVPKASHCIHKAELR